MDLFDAFEPDEVKPEVNHMERLENEKINQARQKSNELFLRLSRQKRHASNGDPEEITPAKIPVTGYI